MRAPPTLLRRLVAVASLGHVVVVVVVAAPSPGCANATIDASKVDTDSMSTVDLGDREYLFYVPTNYEPTVPAPLILSYHGGSRDAVRQAALDQFNSSFFNTNYLVAYPNSVDVSKLIAPFVT